MILGCPSWKWRELARLGLLALSRSASPDPQAGFAARREYLYYLGYVQGIRCTHVKGKP